MFVILILLTTLILTTNSLRCPKDKTSVSISTDCQSFYNCSAGFPIFESCPSRLYWNCMNQKCQTEYWPPCCEDDIDAPSITLNTTCEIENIIAKHKNFCGVYYKCINKTITALKCETGEDFNINKKMCEYNDNCTKPENNMCFFTSASIPDINNCKNYYNCSTGIPTLQSCQDGLNWNCFNMRCEINVWAPCCEDDKNTSAISEQVSCDIEGMVLKSITDCGMYYICIDKTITRMQCPEGQDYDMLKNSCYPSTTGNCAPAKELDTSLICSNGNSPMPVSHDCRRYYNCKSDKPILLKCPYGLYWNCFNERCENTTWVMCCEFDKHAPKTTVETCLIEQKIIKSSSVCGLIYICSNKSIIAASCGAGEDFSFKDKFCYKSETGLCKKAQVKCPSDGLFLPVINDCKSYYDCRTGKAVLKSCSAGFYWNCFNQRCENKVWAPCCEEDENAPAGSETMSCIYDNMVIKSPSICGVYYVCHDSNVIVGTCKPGEDYNLERKKCLPSNDPQCSTMDDTIIYISCQSNNSLIPVIDDCHSYYECSTGVPLKQSCKNGLYWNCFNQQCEKDVWPPCCEEDDNSPEIPDQMSCKIENMVIKSETTCGIYYACVNHTIIGRQCNVGEDYDLQKNGCYPSTNALCADNNEIIKNVSCPLNKLPLPDATCCRSYYNCSSGEPIHQKCPKGLYWHCLNQRCENNFWIPCCEYDMKTPDMTISTECDINDVIVKSPSLCGVFYMCTNNTVSAYECQTGEDFDLDTKECFQSSEGLCVLPGYRKQSEYRNLTCLRNKSPLPVLHDCRSYYNCSFVEPVLEKCPNNLYWNCFNEQCELNIWGPCCEEDIHAPVATDEMTCNIENMIVKSYTICGVYYVCVNNAVIESRCANGEDYNIEERKCIPSTSGICDPNHRIK